MDRENKAVKIRSGSPQKTQNVILSFLAPPYRLAWPRSCWINYPERAMQSRLSCSLPPLQTLLPSPIICLRTLFTVINGTGPDGCLPELDMFPLLQVMCLWYMCFCAEVFFFCSYTVLPNGAESGGKNIFFLSFLMRMLYFS